MKIFATKKRTATGAEKSDSPGNKDASNHARDEEETTAVASYFDSVVAGEVDEKLSSANKKKEFVMDIDELLKMEFGSLNAKQRRLVKRHQQGQAPASGNDVETKSASNKNDGTKETATSDSAESSDSSDNDSSDVESAAGNDKETAEEVKPVKKSADETKRETGGVPPEIQAIVNKDPNGRNSKQRRQLKRYTDMHGEVATTALTAEGVMQQPVKKKRRRNGKSGVSSLSEEESQRRQQQATSAKEMQEKRNLGLIVSDGRHPLNSQRRRANRRKPGKAGMLAAAKRDRKAKFQ